MALQKTQKQKYNMILPFREGQGGRRPSAVGSHNNTAPPSVGTREQSTVYPTAHTMPLVGAAFIGYKGDIPDSSKHERRGEGTVPMHPLRGVYFTV